MNNWPSHDLLLPQYLCCQETYDQSPRNIPCEAVNSHAPSLFCLHAGSAQKVWFAMALLSTSAWSLTSWLKQEKKPNLCIVQLLVNALPILDKYFEINAFPS